jgi:transposase
MIRSPVVTKKYACFDNEDSARLASVIWTITATDQMVGLNVLTYLTACLDECRRNGGNLSPARASNASCPATASPEDLRT